MVLFDKAEATKVFDNYYILYYDPTGAKNIYYTKEDPIMFGVIVSNYIEKYRNFTMQPVSTPA